MACHVTSDSDFDKGGCVTPVTQTRKYGVKHKDTSVVAHLNLTGSFSNNGTSNTRHAVSYVSIDFRQSVPTWLAVASSNQLKPVGSSLVPMTNRQYQGWCGFATSLLLWTSTRDVV